MSVLAERLERAASSVELDRADLARMLDSTPGRVSRWLSNASAPRPASRELILDAVVLLERLSATLEPTAAHDWLFTPNPLLDHYRPVELLGAGELRRVLALIDALGEGAFV